MPSKFVSLQVSSDRTVVETRIRADGAHVEIAAPSLDYWVLAYIMDHLKSGAFLTLRAIPHNEKDEQDAAFKQIPL